MVAQRQYEIEPWFCVVRRETAISLTAAPQDTTNVRVRDAEIPPLTFGCTAHATTESKEIRAPHARNALACRKVDIYLRLNNLRLLRRGWRSRGLQSQQRKFAGTSQEWETKEYPLYDQRRQLLLVALLRQRQTEAYKLGKTQLQPAPPQAVGQIARGVDLGEEWRNGCEQNLVLSAHPEASDQAALPSRPRLAILWV